MKLVVKDVGGFEHTIHGITLDKGVNPTLNTLSDDELEDFQIPEIETAVWFKILIVECITIDCVNRSVTWYSTKPIDESKNNRENSNLLRNKKNVKRISESTYLISEQTNQCSMDIDEVFTETKQIVQNYKHSLAEDVSNAKVMFYQEMFSVLHRYVLPTITLNKEDVPQLEAALDYQHMLIKKQNDVICERQKALKVVSDQQFKLREQYYAEIFAKNDGDKLNFPADIALLLYNHIQEDLSHFSQRLTEAQTDVNLVKKAIQDLTPTTTCASNANKDFRKNSRGSLLIRASSTVPDACHPTVEDEKTDKDVCQLKTDEKESTTKGTIEKESATGTDESCDGEHETQADDLQKLQNEVAEFRKTRDQIFERYKTILQVREILGEYVSDRVILQKDNKKKVTKRQIIRAKLKKLSKSKRKTNIPKHLQYIELENDKQVKVSETRALVEEKVHMISVKEGIKSAIDELKTENIAFGVDFNQSGSLRSTDVLKKRPTLPQWMSLSEQIAQELEDKSSQTYKLHIQGCQRVIMQCSMFQKLHKKYLLSESDSPDNLSVDSSVLGSAFEQSARLSFRGSSSFADSACSGIPLANIRRNPNGSSRNRQLYNYRESCVYSEKEQDGYGFEDLICITRHKELDRDYTYEPPKRTSSLVEIDDTGEFDDVVIVHDTSPEYAQRTVDKLKQDIKKHMDQICVTLQKKLHKDTESDYQKIWTNYERTYFSEIMNSLEQIYTLAYADVLSGLHNSLPKLTPYSLAMDNQVILRLFEDLVEGEAEVKEATNADIEENKPDSQMRNNLKEKESTGIEEEESDTTERSQVAEEKSNAGSSLHKNAEIELQSSEQKLSECEISQPKQHDDDKKRVNFEATSSPKVSIRSRIRSDSAVASCRNRRTAIHENLDVEVEVTLEDPISGMSLAQEDDSTKDRSSTDFNMSLAEQMIQNTANGSLQYEVLRSAPSIQDSQQSASCHSQLYPDLSVSMDSDSTTTLHLDESLGSVKTTNKSKYANVLEQINLDYARQVEKNIHIYYPISVNFWNQERSTWPLIGKVEEEIEFASDAMMLQNSRQGMEPLASRRTFTSRDDLSVTSHRTSEIPADVTQMLYTKSVHIQKPYLQQLSGVVKQLQSVCSESTPTAKLQYAFRALHELGNQVKLFHTQLAGRTGHFAATSADDLTDFLVVLLCNCDIVLVKSLYVNVQIMRDHMPENLETGPFGFALMQLTICLHFLQERIVMQKGLIENERARFSSGLFRM